MAAADPDDYVRDEAMAVFRLHASAGETAPASRRGLPRLPARRAPAPTSGSDPVTIQLSIDAGGQVVGIRASQWAQSFPDSDQTVVESVCRHADAATMPRCFRLICQGDLPDYLLGRIGQIEDQLDDSAKRISALAACMRDEQMAASQIAALVRTTASLRILQEVERADPETKWGSNAIPSAISSAPNAPAWRRVRPTLGGLRYS